MSKKTYVTTERAGFVVAGQRIPPVYAGEGEGRTVKPTVGHKLELTEIEAEYELAQGTITLATEGKKSPARPAGDAA